jgi:cell fate regulator YaaT (PSP1 superfamily)
MGSADDDFEDIDEGINEDTGEDMDEDISALEDDPGEEEIDQSSIIGDSMETMESLALDVPVYRLRLGYSNETFLAIYTDEALSNGTMVMVSTRYGKDLAQVIGPIRRTSAQIFSEITRIERLASKEDLEKAAYDRLQEKEALVICKEKIETHKLDMKLISVHYLLEESKILFFFTAENRVDFRELVKDLVSIFKTRIELRQIGVRDEARVVGGLGVCGRGYCCHMVSDKLKPVSIKMAKDQNLSLNSMKISGVCGRLLCCLAYEHLFYSEQRKIIPPEGCKINHDGSLWKVQEVNVVSGTVMLNTEDGRQLHLRGDQFEKAEGRWRIRETARSTSPADA